MSIERIAMRIVEKPKDKSEMAFEAAKLSFKDEVEENDIDPVGGLNIH